MFPPDVIVHPQPWLSKPREDPILIAAIHASRSGQRGPLWDMAKEFSACVNWFEATSNQAKDKDGNLLGYGACASNIIGGDGKLGIVLPDNRRPTWGMGFGWLGTWAVDWYAISYEVCQATPDTPFTDAQYNRLGFELWQKHKLYGIRLKFLPYLTQTEAPVPSGITRHDNCANGRVYGKTDPGPLFDEAHLLDRIEFWKRQEEDMTQDWHARRWPSGLLRQVAGHAEAAAGLVDHAWNGSEYAELEHEVRAAAEKLDKARQILRDNGLGPETGDWKVDTF